METSTGIWFYRANEKHGYMSNFYKCTFTDINGIQYNCSEQYIIYIKCLMFDWGNNILFNKILNETNPKNFKQYEREINNFNELIWNKNKYYIMCDAINKKFSQNKYIKDKLYMTKDKILYQACKNDRIWGIGYTKKTALNIDPNKYGENLLGEALMRYRDKNPEYIPTESECHINKVKKINKETNFY